MCTHSHTLTWHTHMETPTHTFTSHTLTHTLANITLLDTHFCTHSDVHSHAPNTHTFMRILSVRHSHNTRTHTHTCAHARTHVRTRALLDLARQENLDSGADTSLFQLFCCPDSLPGPPTRFGTVLVRVSPHGQGVCVLALVVVWDFMFVSLEARLPGTRAWPAALASTEEAKSWGCGQW